MQTVCKSAETSTNLSEPCGYRRSQALTLAVLAGIAGLAAPLQRSVALDSTHGLALLLLASSTTVVAAMLLSDWIHHLLVREPQAGLSILRDLLPTEQQTDAHDLESVARQLSSAIAALKQRHAEAEESAETFAHMCSELEQQTYALDQHSIVAMTDVSGRINYANDLFCKISGYTRAELMGKDHRILKSGHHPREFFTEMYRTIRSGLVWRGEVLNKAKSGCLYWVDTTIVPLLDDDGQIDRYIAIRTDITEKKKATDELREAMESAKAGFQAKRDFLATMSHELRTPLNGILGCADLLAETSLTEDQRELITTLQASGRNLLSLVVQLLEMQELRNGSLHLDSAPFRLEEILQSVATSSRNQAERKGLSLRLSIPAPLPTPAPADSHRVEQVLTAMVDNAIKFSSQGTVTLQASAAEGSLLVRVIDEGDGIPDNKRSLLFEEFSQVDPSASRRHGGAGLSLAISRQLVKRMGGTIGHEAAPGGGSVFWFTLPAATDTAAISRPSVEALPDNRPGLAVEAQVPPTAEPRRP